MLKFRNRSSYFLHRSLVPGGLRITAVAVLCILVAAACLVILLIPVYRVSGCSMEPTLHDGDFVLLNSRGSPEAGDVCCFACDGQVYVKRIIALAGSTVDIGAEGEVSVDSAVLREGYVSRLSLGRAERDFPCVVPDGCCFVMGDNRELSLDSRSEAVGFVEEEDIIGRVAYTLHLHR